MTGIDFYIPIPYYSFPFPSLILITIPTGFPLGYCHSHPIPTDAQRIRKVEMQTFDSQATEKIVPQKTGH